MKTSTARLLILTCGLSLALFDIVAALPGNPDPPPRVGTFLLVIALQAFITWRLLHRSRMAWLFIVIVSSSYVLSTALAAGIGWETTFLLSTLLASTQVALLCTPQVLAYVIRQDDLA